jgi:hypothetical protein
MRAARKSGAARLVKKETMLMAVIGRLDEQVEAVLIAPLDKNRPSEPAAPEQDVAEQTTRSPQGTNTHAEDGSSQNERTASAELPVWLSVLMLCACGVCGGKYPQNELTLQTFSTGLTARRSAS